MTTKNNNMNILTPIEAVAAITASFTQAAENLGSSAKQKIRAAATGDEQISAMGDVVVEGMSSLTGSSEASLRSELRTAETLAGIINRALSAKEVAQLVPAHQRCKQNFEYLQTAGYPNLAEIYAPTAPKHRFKIF